MSEARSRITENIRNVKKRKAGEVNNNTSLPLSETGLQKMLVYFFFFFTAITSHISQQSFQERMTQNIWSKRDSVLSSRTKEWNCSFSAAVQRLHNHNHDMQMSRWVVIWACFAASHWIDHDLCIKLVRNRAMILSTTENLQQNGGKVNFKKSKWAKATT